MKNDLTKRLYEASVIEVPEQSALTEYQLTELEKLVKPLLTLDELNNYNNLSPVKKGEYLNGFAANINEWRNAKYAANHPESDNKQKGGGTGMPQPNDGLDHWKPAKITDENDPNGQGKQDNMVFPDIEQEMEKSEKEAKDAQENANNSNSQQSNSSNPQTTANNASDIANSARKIADAAQNAAQQAQNAANQAAANADASGNDTDIENADKSQAAADAAQDLANQASAAAGAAQRAAEAAQEAAANGDMETAAQKAKEAYDATQEAANKTRAAQLNAKSAIQSAKETSNYGDSTQNASEEQIDGMNGKDAAQQAQQAANAAKKAAQQAQAAANAAQTKANNEGTSESQSAADAAQQAADAAQQSAQAAQDAANAAQQAASQGNTQGAQQAAKDAVSNANNAQKSRNEAQQQAGQQNSQSNRNTNPTLEKAEGSEFDPNGEFTHDAPIGADMPFDGNDFFGNDEEMRKKCREIAERAGQPLDAEDYQSPTEYATKKFQEAQNALRTWRPHGEPGKDGNPPTFVLDVLKKLFATKFDWRFILEQFLTEKLPQGSRRTWAKRRMGLSSDHPLYKGRYLHPNTTYFDKPAGITQVFFLVDASGSMGVRCPDGVDIFEHIMSEMIQIELAVNIETSAFATFNTGAIHRDNIFEWTSDDASDESSLLDELKNKIPVAGGGTSAIDGIRSIQQYDDVYSTQDPWTLLVVITDGGDNYNGLKDICEDYEQVEHMIWIITATGENWFNSKKTELMEQGVPEERILFVDINREWGCTEDMVKAHNK